MSKTSIRIAALSIGDELLDGRVKDGNMNGLGQALAELGLELAEAAVVPDDRAVIVAAIRTLAARNDLIVTSGGLGPTSDDVTSECVAVASGVDLRFDEDAYRRMKSMFEGRGIPMPENNRRQAMLPASSRTLENQLGTAPGFVTPLKVDGHEAEVWSFPGVPREYQHLRDDELLPSLRKRLDGQLPRRLVRRTIRSLGLSESAIGERLAAFEAAHSDVRVQYRAAFPEIVVRLVLNVDVSDGSADARADELAAEAKAAIGTSVWSIGDASLEQQVLEVARHRKVTVGTAESCTGGLIAKLLTDTAGSSDVVVGGVVSYANSAKEGLLGVPAALLAEHGAVSAPVAEAMALGAQRALGADVVVSVTGVAGPTGGTDNKPVGTVFFGIATKGVVVSHHKKFPDFGRDRVREMTAAQALRFLMTAIEELPQ
jgi:nicotinamide-nucleotide amidase